MNTFWLILDEQRFVASIMLAQFLIFWFSSKRQKGFIWKSIIGVLIILGISSSYVFIRPTLLRSTLPFSIFEPITISWYLIMVALTTLLCKILFVNTWWENTFRANCAYLLQQIAYILYYGMLLRYQRSILNYWYLRFFIPFAIYGAIYTVVYFLHTKRLNNIKDRESTTDKKMLSISIILFALIVLFNLFMQGYVWRTPVTQAYRGAFIIFMGCTMAAFAQLALFNMKNLNREVTLLKKFLHEKQRQYEISKETIDIINHKCHNLKHHIQAYRVASQDEKDNTLLEIEKAVMIYDTVVKTDNEAVNIILTEKTLHCEAQKIRLACIVDSKDLGFISTIDVYAMLGNALDNAIECVEQYEDPLKRIISLNIHSENGFLIIRMDNYFEGNLDMEEGLPLTTKKDKNYHGFGVKSIKLLVEKYNGTVLIDIIDKSFSLQIVIPLP